MGPGSSQECTVEGQEATSTRWTWEMLSRYMEELFPHMGDHRGVQGGRGLSILGDTPTRTEGNPEKPAPPTPALSGGLDWRPPAVPSGLNFSVEKHFFLKSTPTVSLFFYLLQQCQICWSWTHLPPVSVFIAVCLFKWRLSTCSHLVLIFMYLVII